jgi:hypothetical protein
MSDSKQSQLDNIDTTDTTDVQLKRLDIAGLSDLLNDKEKLYKYIIAPNDLSLFVEGMVIPDGYKKCGHCHHVLKLHLFNINNGAKNKCTGNCKACQKSTASKSYEKTKKNRNYKQYYEQNKERKLAHSKKYYETHKQELASKQKAYHSSTKGKKVMKKAHQKRKDLMRRNVGVPCKREYVIDRDKMGGEFPICYICDKPIKHEREIHVDHVVAVVLGGKDCFTNKACTHEICNLQKTKDCREVTVEQVEMIIERAEKYIDEHPELFEEQKN